MFKYFFPVFLLFTFSATSQINFSRSTDIIDLTNERTPLNVGVADLNGDFIDDICIVEEGDRLNYWYQGTGDVKFRRVSSGQVTSSSEWTLVIGDLNNDGRSEIMTCGAYNSAKILTTIGFSETYLVQQQTEGDFFAQGANFVDIDNDGFLDMFICDDDAESEVYINDQTGMLERDLNLIDMTTAVPSDNSGNYGSEWTDFDSDGDLDLYIAKCRLGVQDPTDPRRINALFVNDGNGNFTEQADDFGLAVGWQSWTANFEDIDNDGDLDCFIVNHDNNFMLLENIENDTFVDISESAGIQMSFFAVQSLLRDFDNDGFVDILVAGDQDYLLMNNGDKTFTIIDEPFEGGAIHSFGVGDLNSDGFLDVYTSYGTGIQGQPNIDDRLFLNDGNDNNWIKISLMGTVSNRSAVGSRVEIYGPWGMQIRDVKAGESYGIVNSMNQSFGIGTSTEVDSVVVRWPSGLVDKLENPTINDQHLIIENNCSGSFFELDADRAPYICGNDTLNLSTNLSGEYLWSTGSTEPSLEVTQEGIYTLTITDPNNGCASISRPIIVSTLPDETPQIEVLTQGEFCLGDTVLVQASEHDSEYEWSNGSMGQLIEVTEPSELTVTIEGVCESFTSSAVNIEFSDADEPIGLGDTIKIEGETAVLTATGDSLRWYDSENALEPIATGSSFETPMLTETTEYWVENVQFFEEANEFVGLEEHLGGSPYSGDQFNGGLFFDVLEDITIVSVKVTTDLAGPRTIEIRDGAGAIVYSEIFELEEGESRINLNAQIPSGTNYLMTTNSNDNLTNFGFQSPRLMRDDGGVDFPYVLDSRVSIVSSVFGNSRYYYFYDWEIAGKAFYCASERILVEATVILSSVFDIDNNSDISITPNPTQGEMVIAFESDDYLGAQAIIVSQTGKILRREVINSKRNTLYIDNLNDGVYYLIIESSKGRYFKKVVKI